MTPVSIRRALSVWPGPLPARGLRSGCFLPKVVWARCSDSVLQNSLGACQDAGREDEGPRLGTGAAEVRPEGLRCRGRRQRPGTTSAVAHAGVRGGAPLAGSWDWALGPNFRSRGRAHGHFRLPPCPWNAVVSTAAPLAERAQNPRNRTACVHEGTGGARPSTGPEPSSVVCREKWPCSPGGSEDPGDSALALRSVSRLLPVVRQFLEGSSCEFLAAKVWLLCLSATQCF